MPLQRSTCINSLLSGGVAMPPSPRRTLQSVGSSGLCRCIQDGEEREESDEWMNIWGDSVSFSGSVRVDLLLRFPPFLRPKLFCNLFPKHDITFLPLQSSQTDFGFFLLAKLILGFGNDHFDQARGLLRPIWTDPIRSLIVIRSNPTCSHKCFIIFFLVKWWVYRKKSGLN